MLTRPRSYRSFFRLSAVASVLAIVACSGAKRAPTSSGVVDANNDGIADSLKSSFVDTNGDGKTDAADTIDIDANGIPDGRALDTDGDGVADAAGIDSNADGIIDQIDKDGDGAPEQTADDGSGGTIQASDDFGETPATGGSTATPDGEYCQQAEIEFVPKLATVYVLVDRSNSMFATNPNYWDALRDSVLPVLDAIDGEVRLGFGTYTGSPTTCTGLTPGAPIALNNYDAIATAYNAFTSEGSGDTPTPQAIEQATQVLLDDATANGDGDKYIMLVTDGDPDFCDNPAPQCGADALVASLQIAARQGIKTLVFGIDNPQITPEFFDYYAQAGWGEMPAWDHALDVTPYNGKLDGECKSVGDWASWRTKNESDPAATCSPLPPEGDSTCFPPAGKYSAAGGEQTAFLDADPAKLAEVIRSNLDSLKSCTFDLSQSNVEVKPGLESTGDVFVNEVLIPKEQWQMTNATTIELLGEACTTWQLPEVTQFFAGFPCQALIIK